jgi:hypothetical protein
MASAAQNPSNVEPGYRRLATHWRVIISLVLLVHLAAVFVAPMALPPSSQLVQEIRKPFSDYLNVAYLDHGYRFFAPEPGPSHLVRYKLEMPDGSLNEGTFPDLKTQWPRLIYHRHFMLSEKFFGYGGPDLPPTATAQQRQQWQAERDVFNAIAKSYAQHLISVTGARKATLQLVEHRLALPEQVAAGQKLTDPKLYDVLWTETFERDPS